MSRCGHHDDLLLPLGTTDEAFDVRFAEQRLLCDALASTIDLLPTIAAITGTPLPADRAIDGIDISSLRTGTAKSVRNEFLYYNAGGRIEGIREGDWKLLTKESAGKPGCRFTYLCQGSTTLQCFWL